MTDDICDEVEFDRSVELRIRVTPDRVVITADPPDPQEPEDREVMGRRATPPILPPGF